jgi:chromodomain-helicase-DNA-binding protein 1
MVGIHWYGYGNWEKIRLDPKLGLTTKIAPATLGERETFLPRAPNLDNRASALLQKVLSPHLYPQSCHFYAGTFGNS